jgi:predicted nucleic acid-binding protein
MKVAITDACIFIDLIELRLTSEFFGLQIEIHTSLEVYNELYPEHQELLKAYQSIRKLIIHNITYEERILIQNEKFPRSLSEIDKSVIFLAEKYNAMILSSDKAVRNFARDRAIEFHGMLWIFDRLIEFNLITKPDAVHKIQKLISNNIVYRNNMELVSEISKRIDKWS